MAKPSGLLRRMDRKNSLKYKFEFLKKINILQQMCIDAAFMAANDVFQMGPGRCKQFGQAMVKYLNEMCVMMLEDGKCDDELIYTRAKIDERLKKICGAEFDPWEVRYKDED